MDLKERPKAATAEAPKLWSMQYQPDDSESRFTPWMESQEEVWEWMSNHGGGTILYIYKRTGGSMFEVIDGEEFELTTSFQVVPDVA